MTHAERIRWCEVCTKRSFHLQQGLLCGLTGAKPVFEGHCPHHEPDTALLAAREHQEAQARERRRRDGRMVVIAASALLGLAGLAAFWMLLGLQRDRAGLADEFERFANELAIGIAQGRPETIDTALHHASIFAAVRRLSGADERVWDRALLDGMRIGERLTASMDGETGFELIALDLHGRTATALYRMLGTEGMEHWEMSLTGRRGRVWIADIFRYGNGLRITEGLAEALRTTRAGGSATLGLTSAEALMQQLHEGKVDDVWEAVMAMDPAVRCGSVMRLIYLDAAAWRSLDEYKAAIDEVAAVANPDPRFLTYRRMSWAQYAQDGPATLAAIDALEPHLGRDPWMQALRARAQLWAGDTAACFNALDRGLRMAPMDANLHMERFDLLARCGRYAQALAAADTLIHLFGYLRADLAAYLDSIPGIDTSRALYDWRASGAALDGEDDS